MNARNSNINSSIISKSEAILPYDEIGKYDVISFDIFDTLLLRKCINPEYVFEEIERKSGRKGFCKARIRADKIAGKRARGKGSDASLDDAYEFIPEFADLRQKELDEEESMLVGNEEAIALWNRAGALGKKRVIVSDMYLPQHFLEKVLRQNGISGWDGFYLSCTRGCRKSTGELYKLMLEDLGVAKERVFHVGDNGFSDFKMAIKSGIEAFQYSSPVARLIDENPFVLEFISRSEDLNYRIFVFNLALGFDKYRMSAPTADYWSKIGYLFCGPLGFLFMSEANKYAGQNKTNQVWFVARDGWVLEKIFKLINPEIATRYIYAPRQIISSISNEEGLEYVKYARALGDGNALMIDSCSAAFTSQHLLSNALNHRIRAYYLIAMSKCESGSATLFYDPYLTLNWSLFSEFLFSAPTPPIVSVKDNEPIYQDGISPAEEFKISIYEIMAKAGVEGARQCRNLSFVFSQIMWLDWIESFMRNMTRVDKANLQSVKSGIGVGHSSYVTCIEPLKRFSVIKYKAIPYRIRHIWRRRNITYRQDFWFGFMPGLIRKSVLFS